MIDFSIIQQQLNLLSANRQNSFGLYTGKTGAAFCYFSLSTFFQPEYNIQKGEELIGEVISHIHTIKDTSFSEGLCGIGWGICALLQNGYKLPYTESILNDIDDLIYKYNTFIKPPMVSLEKGSVGSLLYFGQRLKSLMDNSNWYRLIMIQECISLLISDLQTYLTHKVKGLLNRPKDTLSKEEIQTIAQCVILFQYLREEKVNLEQVGFLLWKLKDYIEQSYKQSDIILGLDIYLLHAYIWLSGQTGNKSMREQGDEWLRSYEGQLIILPLTSQEKYLYCSCKKQINKKVENANRCSCLKELSYLIPQEEGVIHFLRGELLI